MCPDELILAAFIDNALNHEKKLEIKNHLDRCPLCLEKVFFIKKALMREPLFLKEKTNAGFLKKLVLKMHAQGMLLLEKVSASLAEPLELAFRDSHESKKAVKVFLGSHELLLESLKPGEFSLTLAETIDLTVKTPQGRILFQGLAEKNRPLIFYGSGTYQVSSGAHEITLEIL